MIDLNLQGSLHWITSGQQSSLHFFDLFPLIRIMEYLLRPTRRLSIISPKYNQWRSLSLSVAKHFHRWLFYSAITRQFAEWLEACDHKRSNITELFLEATRPSQKNKVLYTFIGNGTEEVFLEFNCVNYNLQGHDGFNNLLYK